MGINRPIVKIKFSNHLYISPLFLYLMYYTVKKIKILTFLKNNLSIKRKFSKSCIKSAYKRIETRHNISVERMYS